VEGGLWFSKPACRHFLCRSAHFASCYVA
jgi:hypothetical protein